MSPEDLDRLLVRPDGAVPKGRYVEQAFLDLELDRLWSRVWQVAGRVEELAGPGELPRVRDRRAVDPRGAGRRRRAARVRQLLPAPRHRLAAGCGAFADGEIRCPYHAWTYDLDGRLGRWSTGTSSRRSPTASRLGAVRVDTWGGFVFVNLDPDAPPLLDYLDPLPAILAPYHLEEMRLRSYRTTVLPANWKVVVDAFNEGYHVQGTHPQILPWTDDVSIEYEPLGIHSHYGRLASARRQLRPSPRLGLGPDEFDEGEILAGLVVGLGGAFLGEERALVEEVRGATGARPAPRCSPSTRAGAAPCSRAGASTCRG